MGGLKMAENKKSFLLYCDLIHVVKKLSDEQAGKLLKHILSYVNDENPEMSDILLDLVFEPIKQNLKRDLQKWENICERNRVNGEKGGRPKKEPKKPSGLNGNPKNPSEPKKADNDNDIDNDIDSDININIQFSEFWDQYPKSRKTRKEYCKEYWEKRLTNPKRQMIMEKLNLYIASTEEKYLKTTEYFFKNEKFKDDAFINLTFQKSKLAF
jgi:hypothetical protein